MIWLLILTPQDERVMQLFSLANTLLEGSHELDSRHCNIQVQIGVEVVAGPVAREFG
jgi:hypothetical protein